MSRPSGAAVGSWPLRRVLCSGQGGALTWSFGLSPDELESAAGFLEVQNVSTLSSLSCCSDDDLSKAFANCHLSLGQKAMIRGVAAKARSLMGGPPARDAPGKDVAASGAAAAAPEAGQDCGSSQSTMASLSPVPAAPPSGAEWASLLGDGRAHRRPQRPDPQPPAPPAEPPARAAGGQEPARPWSELLGDGRSRRGGAAAAPAGAQAREDPVGKDDSWASRRPADNGNSAKAREDPLGKNDPWAPRRPEENVGSVKAFANWPAHPGDEPSPATSSRAGAPARRGEAAAASEPSGAAGWAALLGDERSLARGPRGGAPARRDCGAAPGEPAGQAEPPSGWAEVLGDGRGGRSAAARSHAEAGRSEGGAGGASASGDWDGSRREVPAAARAKKAGAKKKRPEAPAGQAPPILPIGAHDFKSQLNVRFSSGKGISYEVRSDGRNYYARVRVAEHGFFNGGQPAETRKGAEQLAARAALHALGYEKSSGAKFAGVRDVDASADSLYKRTHGMSKEQRMQVAEQEATRLFELFPPEAKLVLGTKGAKHLLQYKVHLCPEYERGRTCWRKKYCTFAHGYEEMLQCSVAERIRAAGKAMLELGAERFWEQAVEAAESLSDPGAGQGAASGGAQRGAEPPRGDRRGEDPWHGSGDPWGGGAGPRQPPRGAWGAAAQGEASGTQAAKPPHQPDTLDAGIPPGAAAPAGAAGRSGGRGGGKGQGKQSREAFRRDALEAWTKALFSEAEGGGATDGTPAMQELWLGAVGAESASHAGAPGPAECPAAGPAERSWPSWQEIEVTCHVVDDAQSSVGKESGGGEGDGAGADDDDDISSEDFEEPLGRGPAGQGLPGECQ